MAIEPHSRVDENISHETVYDYYTRSKVENNLNIWNDWINSINVKVAMDFTYLINKHAKVLFNKHAFPSGRLNFESSIISGNDKVQFREIEFKKCSLYFNNSQLRNTVIQFCNVHSNYDVDIYFNGINSDDRAGIIFDNCQFMNINLFFDRATFGNKFMIKIINCPRIDKIKCTINNSKGEESIIEVLKSNIESGIIEVNDYQDDKGELFISENTMDCLDIRVIDSSFKTVEIQPDKLGENSTISLQKTKIDGLLILNNIHINSPIDLRGARYGKIYEIDNCSFQVSKESISESSKFRILKNIAKTNNNHKMMLDFFAKECRALYNTEHKSPYQWLYKLYDVCSNYGRSIKRPFCAYILLIFAFSLIYFLFSGFKYFWSALSYSLSNSIPGYIGFKDLRKESGEMLIDHFWSEQLFYFIAGLQNIFSAIFLFLILLALRNLLKT